MNQHKGPWTHFLEVTQRFDPTTGEPRVMQQSWIKAGETKIALLVYADSPDAALFAAAPDLLDALVVVRSYVREYGLAGTPELQSRVEKILADALEKAGGAK